MPVCELVPRGSVSLGAGTTVGAALRLLDVHHFTIRMVEVDG